MPIITRNSYTKVQYCIECDTPGCGYASTFYEDKDLIISMVERTWLHKEDRWYCPSHKYAYETRDEE